MALDGIVLSNIVNELSTLLTGGRIDKISQPEKDEIILNIRNNRSSYKLLLTSQASFPRIHLTQAQKNSPLTAPSFCMLLRKYLNSAKIIEINQPVLERIVEIKLEHLNELGDLCKKILIIEIMGRHSNIILCDECRKVLDSIKHVNAQMSSVREVYPGKEYFYPPNQDKYCYSEINTINKFINIINKPMEVQRAIYTSIIGFSPLIAEEICYLSRIDSNKPYSELNKEEIDNLYASFNSISDILNKKQFSPVIYINQDNKYEDFYSFTLKVYDSLECQAFSSVSDLMDVFFEKRSNDSRISQKSSDIRKLVQNNLERCSKKLELQLRQLQDTENREQYKIKGELIHSNLYQIEPGQSIINVFNYYTNQEEKITLDVNLTPIQNAQKYYAKYNKKKRTLLALTDQIEQTKNELNHLESIKHSLDLAVSEDDISQIKSELMAAGYIKYKKSKAHRLTEKSTPLHYISSDGFHIYVGKNNLQNEELWMKFASGNDWWFHVKDLAGSHVIVKSEGKELTDSTFEEAASLAAFYSKAKNDTKATVDYTLKKNLKKPNGSPLGFVIYHSNYSVVVSPSEGNLKRYLE